MANHVLSHVHRHMLAAVVDGKGVTNEFGEDRGGASPGLDDLLLAGSVHCFNVLQKSSLDERSFLMLLPIVLNSSLTYLHASRSAYRSAYDACES